MFLKTWQKQHNAWRTINTKQNYNNSAYNKKSNLAAIKQNIML